MLSAVRTPLDTPGTLRRAVVAGFLLLACVAAGCRCCVERQEAAQYRHPMGCSGQKRTYTYLVYKPPGFDDPAHAETRWPLMVYLTGALTTGHDVTRQPDGDPPEEIEKGRDFPMVIVSPMTPTFGERWNPAVVIGLIDEVIALYRVDPDRVYLSGTSVGANGIWSTAITYPERIAALLSVSGWGSPRGVERMRDVPVWAFHGALDFVVWSPFHKRMARAHRAAGGQTRWTTIPWRCHNIWSCVYARQDIYDWLLAQRKTRHESAAPAPTPAPTATVAEDPVTSPQALPAPRIVPSKSLVRAR